MHRTTTTATLLVTVAVSALSGCVTVQRPPLSGPSAAPSHPSAPGSGGRAEPQVVQAPAREALELISPSDPPAPTAGSHRPAPAAGSPRGKPPLPRSRPVPSPDDRAARHPDLRVPKGVGIDIPDLAESVRKGIHTNADVCALGRQYGGWRPDSREATICQETYGR